VIVSQQNANRLTRFLFVALFRALIQIHLLVSALLLNTTLLHDIAFFITQDRIRFLL